VVLKDIFCKSGHHKSYDPSTFAALFAVEDLHFWFRARNRIIVALVKQISVSLPTNYRVLDIGCGTGNVLRFLVDACPNGLVVGMDLFEEGLKYACKRTSCPLVQGDINMPPFKKPFDLICLFDVLEHLPDDMQILGNLHSILAPGGKLLLTVPAHPSLWSYFDETSHHCRRYDLEELESKLTRAGYHIEYITQFMASIFPLVWAGRRLASIVDCRGDRKDIRAMSARELRVPPMIVNEVLAWLLSQESWLIASRLRLPIGTSIIALAERI
jgi:SAM-dependent methyltransferase